MLRAPYLRRPIGFAVQYPRSLWPPLFNPCGKATAEIACRHQAGKLLALDQKSSAMLMFNPRVTAVMILPTASGDGRKGGVFAG
jgi:hypothetical protein